MVGLLVVLQTGWKRSRQFIGWEPPDQNREKADYLRGLPGSSNLTFAGTIRDERFRGTLVPVKIIEYGVSGDRVLHDLWGSNWVIG